jgi:hypothetical protein
MRKPAMTRLAGTLSVIPIFVMLSGVATSQTLPSSPVLNSQVNLGEIFSEQTLNVQTVSDGVTASTTAQANGVSVGVTNADAAINSTQDNQGSVYAHGVVDVGANMGAAGAVRTTAVGNSGAFSASNGTISGRAVQTNSAEVTARGQVEAADAEAKDLTVSTLAMGNSQGVTLDNGSAGALITQSTTANVLADGGAIVQYVSGTSRGHLDHRRQQHQYRRRQPVGRPRRHRPGQYGRGDPGQQVHGLWQQLPVGDDGHGDRQQPGGPERRPLADVTSNQWNTSYVRGQAEGASYEFGAAQTSAYAVGNSSQVNNVGPELVLNNLQTNTDGGVEATASFSGQDGYDAVTTATAMGNAVTGYACSKCNGKMTVTNTQTNSADIGATSSTTIASSGRQVTGVSTAIGNNASFNVSAPGY